MMQRLLKFDPHLSGSVLNGHAGRYAQIDIDLFTDSPKVVEYFLIESGMPFKGRERRLYVGEIARTVPNFELETEAAIFSITVFQEHDARTIVRATPGGKPIERIRPERLRAKIVSESSEG
jgi:hypothetical protein